MKQLILMISVLFVLTPNVFGTLPNGTIVIENSVLEAFSGDENDPIDFVSIENNSTNYYVEHPGNGTSALTIDLSLLPSGTYEALMVTRENVQVRIEFQI